MLSKVAWWNVTDTSGAAVVSQINPTDDRRLPDAVNRHMLDQLTVAISLCALAVFSR